MTNFFLLNNHHVVI